VDGGLRSHAPSRRDDLDGLRTADYRRHADGRLAERRLHRRSGYCRARRRGRRLLPHDPAFAYGLSFALAHAEALGRAVREADDVDELTERYRAEVTPEARERYALACETDDARSQRWNGEAVDISRPDGCYPLFAFAAALAAAPHDDVVLRRTIRRIGLLDRTAVFDEDSQLHERIEAIFSALAADPPPPTGPPRDELLALMKTAAAA
jgi:hypothetical protein